MRLARRSLRFSLARFAAFALFALGLLLLLFPAVGTRSLSLSAVGLAAFVGLVIVHDRVVREERRAADLVRIQDEALARLARDWGAMPLPGLPAATEPPPLARDLNLLGRASLLHLLGTAHTPPGKAALASWLLAAAGPAEIALRQAAVAELAPELDLRQELEVRARPLERVPADVEPFLRWAEDRSWLPGWALALARLLALLTVTAGVLLLADLLPLWPFLLLIVANLALSYVYGKRMAATFDRISAREGEFQLYAGVLGVVARRSFASPRLRGLGEDLAAEGVSAAAALDLLHRRVVLSDTRHAALLHTPLQLLLLWDFHTLALLERWQKDFGKKARRWLAALGELEALAALGGLAHDNPEWTFPQVGSQERVTIEARGLGHPLLPDSARVPNDVTLGPPGTFLLVTGSNMSGKSTLLRSLGVNVILAQAGGPVCAESLRLPPLALATSILVEDSLADGVSFFMAELLRIRKVVDAADRAAGEGRVLLYLLDEILRGTNTRERQIAVRRVLAHLLAARALGAVSTHDLELAEIPELAAAVRPVHFRESFEPGAEREGKPVMTFDYKLRPGVATTANALKLLDLVGLGEE
ncbi:MAG TPA: MutS family DNA mismatch repair protein [Thermoanaerobaculia bacterium]|nr:MutS family DNA mismatch repair protein [Thermoanaerobaculia bacterium]